MPRYSTRLVALLSVCALGLLSCIGVIATTPFVADMSAFLPRSPTPQQQLLVDQLKQGIASRVVIVGVTTSKGATLSPEQTTVSLATASKQLAAALRDSKLFTLVANGENVSAQRDQELIYEYRYHLSSRLNSDSFNSPALHRAFKDGLADLAMGSGLLSKDLFFKDPTGETIALIEQVIPSQQPNINAGVWFSKDNRRAMLLLQTQALGSDLDAQQIALSALEANFSKMNQRQQFELQRSGAPIYAVESRANIEREAKLFSSLGTGLILLLLWLVYRSFRLLVLGAVPVIFGAVAGLTAVALGFGSVHGITVGFGVTLIGEAVDYAIYFFIQQGEQSSAKDRQKHFETLFWPTIRLGVMTSICGFCALLFSGFTGLAQLGLFSIIGLVTAAAMTRYVLPYCLHERLKINIPLGLRKAVISIAQGIAAYRLYIMLATLLCIMILTFHRGGLWQSELSALSPVSSKAQALDASLRADVSAPEMGYLLLTSSPTEQAALAASESVSKVLNILVEQKAIAGFESPSLYLPSILTQNERISYIPNTLQLTQNTQTAMMALPLKAGVLQPFINDVAAARTRPALTVADLQGSSLGAALSNLLIKQGNDYVAYFPVRALAGQSLDATVIQRALLAAGLTNVSLLDIKKQADDLYERYLNEAITLSSIGLVIIFLLLRYTLKSWERAVRVLLPQLIAVVWVITLLALLGVGLTLLHLVGLLLVVAVGSNYGLFFDQSRAEELDPRVLVSLVLANITTVIGFGMLALSSVPVLQAFGMTVGPGAFFALILSAALTRSFASSETNKKLS